MNKAELMAAPQTEIAASPFDTQVDRQISTARMYPRQMTDVKRRVLELATLDEETAGTMFYALPPRNGKVISGASIGFAKTVASSYGNIRFGSRIARVEPDRVVAEGFCWDLEQNICCTSEASRSIIDSRGRRYKPDMINTTAMAACSVAERNAVFKVIPQGLFKDVLERAKHVAVGDASSIAEQRSKLFNWFANVGKPEAEVLDVLGCKSPDDVTVEHLVTMRGIATAIQSGELTVEAAFEGVAAQTEEQRTILEKMRQREREAAQAATAGKSTPPGDGDPATNLEKSPQERDAESPQTPTKEQLAAEAATAPGKRRAQKRRQSAKKGNGDTNGEELFTEEGGN